jgi:hypothetical protein
MRRDAEFLTGTSSNVLPEYAKYLLASFDPPTDKDLLSKDYKSKALNGVTSRRTRAHRTFLNIEKKKEFLSHVSYGYYWRKSNEANL